MNDPTKVFNTHTLDVKWSHLHRPDDKFGAPGNHNVSVVVDDQLQTQLSEIQTALGGKKINGMYENEGVQVLKVKSTIFTNPPENGGEKKDTYPCVDANTKPTEAVPFGGDKVRLRLKPMLLKRDGSVSFFLNGVQIIEKGEQQQSSGFAKTEGFDGSEATAPEVETQDTPF